MASSHPQGQYIDASGFDQHQAQTSQLNLPDLDEDLGNLDDLDWSFLGETSTSLDPGLAHTLAVDHVDQDDPFSSLLPFSEETGVEISEAEFFDLVVSEEGEQLYPQMLPRVNSEVLPEGAIENNYQVDDRFDFLASPEFKQDLEIDPEVDVNWESEGAEYTSFMSSADAFNEFGNESDEHEPKLPERSLKLDDYPDFSALQELSHDLSPEYIQDLEQDLGADFGWQADDADDLTSILSPRELLAKLRAEEWGASSTIATEDAFENMTENLSKQENNFELPNLFDIEANSNSGNLDLDVSWESEDVGYTSLMSEEANENSVDEWNIDQFSSLPPNSSEVKSEITPQAKLDNNSFSSMPEPKSNDYQQNDYQQVVDPSMLNFEDPEDLDEEISFSNTAFSLPDLNVGTSTGQNQYLAKSLVEDFSEANNFSQLPELKSDFSSNLVREVTDRKRDDSFSIPIPTLIPAPTKSSETNPDTPNYLAGFSQEFVKSNAEPDALPSLPSLPGLPLPRLPQMPQLPQKTESYTQPVARMQPSPAKIEQKPENLTSARETKKADTKSGQDDKEQDWLDSFDEMANDIEWEELSGSPTGIGSQVKDDTPTSFVATPVKSKTIPNASPNSTAQKLPNLPPKAELSSTKKTADVFSIDDDSMDWTAVLDSDTEFVKEINSIQEQKKSLNPKENSKERSLNSDPNDRFSSRSEAEDFFAQPLMTQPKLAIDLGKYAKPLAIAGGAIAAVILFITFLGAGIGRFTLENGLKLGIFKDAQDKNLKGANLERGNLRQANLSRANLEGANLRGTILVNADLRGTNIKGANLRGAKLNGAKLELVNKKNLTKLDNRSLLMWQIVNQPKAGRNLAGANLDGFNLDSANLRNANLSRAKLTWVNFENANLNSANLAGADISGTNFTKANLKGAVFGGTKWDKQQAPKTDATTTCPNGKKGPCPLR